MARTIIKLPAAGEHLYDGSVVHLVNWHNDDYYVMTCERGRRDWRPRTLQSIVDARVDCVGCLAAGPDPESL